MVDGGEPISRPGVVADVRGLALVKAESLVCRCALASRSAQIDGSDVSIFEDRIQQ